MPTSKVSPRGGAVRLTMPAKLANDLGSLQKALGALAERMGHPSCATGCDVLFLQLERDFALRESGELNPQPLPPGPPPEIRMLPQDPVPDARAVTVAMPASVNNDLEALRKALAVTVGKLGCRACCSGFDITFRQELDLIAIDEKIKAQGFGRFR